jgi:hypothetical protein
MLSEVDCKKCDEFLTQGHVCLPTLPIEGSQFFGPDPLAEPSNIYQISKMVYEALHPEEDSAEAL